MLRSSLLVVAVLFVGLIVAATGLELHGGNVLTWPQTWSEIAGLLLYAVGILVSICAMEGLWRRWTRRGERTEARDV